MSRGTWVEISTGALEQNLRQLKVWTGADYFCPMVKADAYGHGAVHVAAAAQRIGVDALGVALVEEGVALREHGITAPILCFAPLHADEVGDLARLRITPVVGRLADLKCLVDGGYRGPLHLKFNTGMQRLGFDEGDLPALRAALDANRECWSVTGLCTHLTHGEDAGDPGGPTAAQIARFHALSAGFEGRPHLHKSASLLRLRERRSGVGARPGIAVYGLPSDGADTPDGLRPVLSWRSEIVAVHALRAGEAVSYGATWTAPGPALIGAVPVGYGDGYSRRHSNTGFMLVRGRRVPVAGRVCMDYTLLDLTAIAGPAIAAGEPVTLIGAQGEGFIGAGEVAQWQGTISYEVVTQISRRVPRVSVP